ncbi:hypothetical protein L9F63_018906, partial [Diploptera punctata]
MAVPKEKDPGRGTHQLMGKKVEMVPPDGGWGWVVVFAFALSNVIAVPIVQSFGLLFQGKFDQLELSATDASVIINVNSSFGMILGLFNGFILRSFGYRKVAIVGAIINSLGVILTSQADSFIYFVITYGVISSIGFNLLASSFNLALNTYFRERRGKAVGFAATAMGLGPVFMPLVISLLMSLYGISGTALLLGGFVLNSLVAALLLQPIKWHMKPKKLSPEELEEASESEDVLQDTEKTKSLHGENEHTKRQRTVTHSSSIDHDIDVQSIYGFETPLLDRKTPGRRRNSSVSFKRSTSHVEDPSSKQRPADVNWWTSAASINSVNLGSSVRIFDEKSYQPLQDFDVKSDIKNGGSRKNVNEDDSKTALTLATANANGIGNISKLWQLHLQKKDANGKSHEKDKSDSEDEEQEKELTFWQKLGRGIVTFFDLTLFKDPIYVSLMFGMSLAICAEFNFSLLTPFILKDRGFDTDSTAQIMSVIAGLDIIFRFIVPFFSDHFKISARNMYSFALILLVSSRTALIFSESFNSVMIVAVALGVAKGVRTVYMTIVIPNYVPIERLAAASGIQMVTNGLLLISFGPLIGVIRDFSGSYNWCIAFINLLTVVTLTLWTVESLITAYLKHRRNPDDG